ncbi:MULTISPECIES: hypothetical protein [Peribacillus]|uniref:hypothetical protein n=1 Tax=Peribacillus frigoritolerans TaxID=450367 RepID=UPI003DA1115F
MTETKISYQMNGFTYILETFKDLLKITRNGEVIHVQFKEAKENKVGLKSLNDIIGNLSEYISSCETGRKWSIEFREDDWSKKTLIYADILYAFPFGIKEIHCKDIDSFQGEMSGNSSACVSKVEDYWGFVSNARTEILPEPTESTPWSKEQLLTYLNRKSGAEIINY